ncbi:SCO0607 family lipoprotein [Streptomyces sp. NPDC059017]|uniref:SCO0607 family lipoprotein n=1 Tax=unclassified Streptomyces TaxID=2593676 RepID=UPI0036CE3ECB
MRGPTPEQAYSGHGRRRGGPWCRTSRPNDRSRRPPCTCSAGSTGPPAHRPTDTPERRGRPCGVAAAALAAEVAAAALTGCSFRDDIRSEGEYPVIAVGNTGSACVPEEERPPKGYTRYPEGKVPQKVDDEWDVYWRTHTVDEEGDVVDTPDAG